MFLFLFSVAVSDDKMDSDFDTDEELSDFDEDEDPDKVEIPGTVSAAQNTTYASFPNTPQPKISSFNAITMEKLKSIIAANPQYLTSGIPNEVLSQMMQNYQPPLNQMSNSYQTAEKNEALDDENEDEMELGVAEVYADYMPSKLKIGVKHPDSVVETTSLSSVEPVDVYYNLSLQKEVINSGALSALQLEAIVYACQAHNNFLPDGSRAGFLVGDGAGVGKGRTIAGIISENFFKNRKRAIWISVSNDLKYDAERDLADIGSDKIPVASLNKFKYAKINSSVNGYFKKGVVFGTYSALISETQSTEKHFKSRLKQLLQWCGHDFDGVIVFDECHKAKNLYSTGSSKPTKTGLAVLDLQKKLPKARIVYASATGASEPRNMAYMVRLGIWGGGTPFPTFNDFIEAVEKRGVGAMEIVAMDMKLRGMYIARQLSFHGVTFRIQEVKVSNDFKKIYNTSVDLWIEAMQKFTEAAELISAESRMKKTMWAQFWSAHQRFFKYLCIAAKVNCAVSIAREAIKYGKCVVIGLQSTGEARTLEQLEKDDGELSDFVSTAKGVLESLVEKHFPAPNRDRTDRLVETYNPIPSTSRSVGIAKRKSTTQIKFKTKMARGSSPDSRSSSENSSDEPENNDFEDDEDDRNFYDSDNSDDNPFRNVDDSDDDEPWVKKSGKKIKDKPKATPNPKEDAKLLPLFSNRLQKSTEIKPNHSQPSTEHIKFNVPSKFAIEQACQMKADLLEKIEKIGKKLPPNTLDHLIDELGGPSNVAEMTGRKGRVVQFEDGTVQYESRSEQDANLEILNVMEKQRFMNGEKDVAIISEAASSGISLQSDRRAKNQRRRVHITLELPWSADRAIQQFGRTHRSNQVNAPEYVFLISDLAGERRFASTVAKRLECLGALTHGDRRATESRDLSQFNIDNLYGRRALEAVMRAVMQYETPILTPPKNYKGNFFKDIAAALVGVGLIVNSEQTPGILTLDKDYNNMSKFLNRILGIPVDLQNQFFQYFTDVLETIIQKAKKSGNFDSGIADLGANGEKVIYIKLTRFLRKHSTGLAPCELHEVQIERGMSWQEAKDKCAELTDPMEGFYLSKLNKSKKLSAILVTISEDANLKQHTSSFEPKSSKSGIQCQVLRPNIGLQRRLESLSDIEKKYMWVSSEKAEDSWTEQYITSSNTCSHMFYSGICRNKMMGIDCEIGLKRRTYFILSGSVLSVWSRVENMLATKNSSKMQVIRLRTNNNKKIVGILIPKTCVNPLIQSLAKDAEKVEEKSFK